MDRREVLRILATGSLLQLAPANLLAVLGEARSLLAGQAALRTLSAQQYATVKTMVSSSCVNPSLTYMALTARACDHAVSQMKKGEL